MANRHLNIWRSWLQISSVGLLIFAAFAPLSDTPHGILTLVAVGGLLAFLFTDSPASRKETARFLIVLAALVLLAWLLSINPKWVLFGSLGGVLLWEVFKLEHDECQAERDDSSDARVG